MKLSPTSRNVWFQFVDVVGGGLLGAILLATLALFISLLTFAFSSIPARMAFWSNLGFILGAMPGIGRTVVRLRCRIPWAVADNAFVGALLTIPLVWLFAWIRQRNLEVWDERLLLILATGAAAGALTLIVLGRLDRRFRFTHDHDPSIPIVLAVVAGVLVFGACFFFVGAPDPWTILGGIVGVLIGPIGLYASREANPTLDQLGGNLAPVQSSVVLNFLQGDWISTLAPPEQPAAATANSLPLFAPTGVPRSPRPKRTDVAKIESRLRSMGDSSDDWVNSAKRLGEIGDFAAIPALMAQKFEPHPTYYGDDYGMELNNRDFQEQEPKLVQAASVEAIARIEERTSNETLRALLEDPQMQIRRWAAKLLKQRGWSPVTLADRFFYDFAGVQVEQRDPDNQRLPYLLDGLSYGDADVRGRTAHYLAGIHEPSAENAVETLLAQPDTETLVVFALRPLIDSKWLQPLLEAANRIVPEQDFSKRNFRLQSIAETLETASEPVLEQLAASISTLGTPAQLAAAVALGRRGDRRAVEPLLAALAEGPPPASPEMPERLLWTEALQALGTIRDSRAVATLVPFARLGTTYDYRPEYKWGQVAREALVAIGDNSCVTALLSETPEEAGWYAPAELCEACAKLQSPAAIPFLERIVERPYGPAQHAAAQAALEKLRPLATVTSSVSAQVSEQSAVSPTRHRMESPSKQCLRCGNPLLSISGLVAEAKSLGFDVADDTIMVHRSRAREGDALDNRKGFRCRSCGNHYCMKCILAAAPPRPQGGRGCFECQSAFERLK